MPCYIQLDRYPIDTKKHHQCHMLNTPRENRVLSTVRGPSLIKILISGRGEGGGGNRFPCDTLPLFNKAPPPPTLPGGN